MSMSISPPWLARRNSATLREKGGPQVPDEWAPSRLLVPALDVRGRTGQWARERRRRWLSLKELRIANSRGVFCRACVRTESSTAAKWQSGRERPPLPPPGPGPEQSLTGVAHAPAACLVCPDERVLARVVDTTLCRSCIGQPARRAQRIEAVACRCLYFLNRRTLCH